ncbi:hypothetical protein ACQKM9_20845 [Viridibacillus sp. NPDC093762]|uniref:hypothetical protein n=1 Tax=Viridibacillus sp. NPDC093762 TaxID=3390720 RepID=UPI003CFE1191
MKLHKILGVVFIFLSLTLSACSQDGKEYSFYGKSKNWIVMYETEISEERGSADYSIEYIGKEPAPEIFGYNIKSSWFEFGVNEETFNEENNVHSGNSECTGPPSNDDSCEVSIKENEKMEAVLEWNGKSEVIEMYRN